MKRSGASQTKASKPERLFGAEAAYADSMVRSAFGDHKGSLSALKQALALKPDYAPAILSMGSVEYQRRRSAQGRKLFRIAAVDARKHAGPLPDHRRGREFSHSGLARTRMAGRCTGRLSRDSPPPRPYIRDAHAALVTRVSTTRRWRRPSGHCSLSRTVSSWSTTSVGASSRQAASKRPSKCSSRQSPWTHPMSWRERTFASVRRVPRSRGRKPAPRKALPVNPADRPRLNVAVNTQTETNGESEVAKLGTKKHPAVVRVRSISRAEEIVSLCTDHGWQVIAGVEPDVAEDVSDVEKLLGRGQEAAPAPRLPPKISPNDYCPCRSGKKFKKCCGAG